MIGGALLFIKKGFNTQSDLAQQSVVAALLIGARLVPGLTVGADQPNSASRPFSSLTEIKGSSRVPE